MLHIIIPVILLLLTIGAYFYITNNEKKKSSSTKKSVKSADTLQAEQELANLQNKTSSSQTTSTSSTTSKNSNKNGEDDVNYLLTNLHPDKSTHLDVLLLIATTPENINMTMASMEKENQIIQQKIDALKPKKDEEQKNSTNNDKDGKVDVDDDDNGEFDLDGDWGDDEDDEEDENIRANKKRQEEKEKLAQEVARASGKNTNSMLENVKVEGVDDGVLGQKWVERTLGIVGCWPPVVKSEFVDVVNGGRKRDLGEWMDENKAVRRNVCMTMGRLYSNSLNTHPELVAAGPKKLIDTIYFQASMEYRKRTIVLVEAALRILGSTRSYKLYKTLVECYTMFKLGVPSINDEKVVATFQKQMEKTMGGPNGVPRIIISTLDISTPDEKEIVNEDASALDMKINRVHGENFMKQRVQMAMKQGIPPEIALQSFREGWWILLRCEKMDGDSSSTEAKDDGSMDHIDKHPMLASLTTETKNKYKSQSCESRLINAWPFVVSNMKQEIGQVKVRFMAPKVPGKYKFYIDVKSQEYLGCDQTFVLEREILDKDTVVRTKKEEVKAAE